MHDTNVPTFESMFLERIYLGDITMRAPVSDGVIQIGVPFNKKGDQAALVVRREESSVHIAREDGRLLQVMLNTPTDIPDDTTGENYIVVKKPVFTSPVKEVYFVQTKNTTPDHRRIGKLIVPRPVSWSLQGEGVQAVDLGVLKQFADTLGSYASIKQYKTYPVNVLEVKANEVAPV